MTQNIWQALEAHRGMWIAFAGNGEVLGTAAELGALRADIPTARTYVFANA